MKLLFVALDSRVKRYGIMSLSAFLKKDKRHQVFLEEYTDFNTLKSRFDEISPDFVAYSCMSGEYNKAREINRQLKSKVKPFVSLWGGPHPTYSQEIINDEGVDAVCVGEGEGALLELCDRWQGGRRQYDIKNWLFKVDGRIIKNPLRPLIDINTLPVPDFNIFKSGKKEYVDVYVTRGCYFNCTYCFNHRWKELYNNFANPIRTLSIERAMEVLKYVKTEFADKIKYICFHDDTLPIKDKNWITAFSQAYREHIGIPFYINMYPTMADEENLGLLKQAGLFKVNFAMESGNEYIRQEVLGRKMSNEKILKAAEILHRHRLLVSIQNITCLPREDFRKTRETFELNIKCRPHIAAISKFVPFPGIKLTELAIKDNHLKRGEFEDKIPDDYHWRSLLNFKDKKDKCRMEYMVNLFTLGVAFPFLKPLIYLMVKAPDWPIIKRFYAHIDNQAWSVITHQDFDQTMRTLHRKNESIRLFFKIISRVIFAREKTEAGG
ncbi:MAG: B12-binding domain-containing radical SAM protein [Candidatus Omnitrophota bacterium]|nr:MAG: B12-binding domain-containing radical SAM protein [Candidatus Omnitrophota bacterium]